MPKRIRKLEDSLKKLESLQRLQILVMETFAKGMEEHMALIKELRNLVKRLEKHVNA